MFFYDYTYMYKLRFYPTCGLLDIYFGLCDILIWEWIDAKIDDIKAFNNNFHY